MVDWELLNMNDNIFINKNIRLIMICSEFGIFSFADLLVFVGGCLCFKKKKEKK